jgi:hypothetical protein
MSPTPASGKERGLCGLCVDCRVRCNKETHARLTRRSSRGRALDRFGDVVWNVVLNQTIVLAGRRYIEAATGAAQSGDSYARMDDWMRPAVTRGLWFATASAAGILIVRYVSMRAAARRSTN